MRGIPQPSARAAGESLGKLLTLLPRMARLRVVALPCAVMTLAASARGEAPGIEVALAALALALAYACAAALNDVADEVADGINKPAGVARPLLDGTARPRDLLLTAAVAAAASLILAAALGASFLIAVAILLAVSVAYSMPPLALAARTYAAPLVLCAAYVALPYAMGVSLRDIGGPGNPPGEAPTGDVALLCALVTLFLGRVLLKDLRDREGDAAQGRRTFLLVHGRRITALVCVAALLAGDALLSAGLVAGERQDLAFALQGYVVGAALAAGSLLRAKAAEAEAAAVVGRMGNGLIAALLVASVLQGVPGTQGEQVAFAVSLSTLLWIGAAPRIAACFRPSRRANSKRGGVAETNRW